MTRRKLHVVYEHGPDLRPFGSAHIRLLRPLTHPSLRDVVELTAGWDYGGEPADLVMVDRLWRADVSVQLAQDLIARIRKAGARFAYALDDDFLSLYAGSRQHDQVERTAVVETFLRAADGLIVTTEQLRQRFHAYNPRCVVVPNALDERLLVNGGPGPMETPFGRRRLVIGYMGTRTHGADLAMVWPAWKAVYAQLGDAVEFQLLGVVDQLSPAWQKELPLHLVQPLPEEVEYPLFLLWLTSHLRWDIAVAPLLDTPANRSKSDIKFLDYCALGAAGIFSDLPPYQRSVVHQETGWLCEDSPAAWQEALCLLATDEALRTTLAHNATQHLLTRRTLAQTAHQWTAAIEELLAGV